MHKYTTYTKILKQLHLQCWTFIRKNESTGDSEQAELYVTERNIPAWTKIKMINVDLLSYALIRSIYTTT